MLKSSSKQVMDLVRILRLAKEGVDYDYSSLQIDLPQEVSSRIIQWGKAHIPEENLYDTEEKKFGRENDIHVTLLYGIIDKKPKRVQELLSEVAPFEVRLGLVSFFKDHKDRDVVKIDVESSDLLKLHYDIRKGIDNKNDYPTYNPHVTVAYVKKRSCDDLIGDDFMLNKKFTVNTVVFSSSEGTKVDVQLK